MVGDSRTTQYEDSERGFSRSSSRPNSRVTIDTGVTSAKNRIPSTTGLTTLPSSSPKWNHALLNGASKRGAMIATSSTHAPVKARSAEVVEFQDAYTPYRPTTTKITENVNPKVRSDGSLLESADRMVWAMN